MYFEKLKELGEATASELFRACGEGGDIVEVYAEMESYVKTGLVMKMGNKFLYTGKNVENEEEQVRSYGEYYDYNKLIPMLERYYELKIPTLLIGPHGCGKTLAVTAFARIHNIPFTNIPCSAGIREHHIVGKYVEQADGHIEWEDGLLTRSMKQGGITCFDELTTADDGVILRLDEALDARRELTLHNGVVKAKEGWWPVATLNSLDHIGTRQLPTAILSRFAIRVYVDYPSSLEEEILLVESVLDIPPAHKADCAKAVKVVRGVRKSKTEYLPYRPSIRESVAVCSLIVGGMELRQALKYTVIDVYSQWGNEIKDGVDEYVDSLI